MHGHTLDSNETVGVASHFLVLHGHTIDFLNKGSRPTNSSTINHHLVLLPTFDQLADCLVLLTRQTFGKVVSTLLLGINLQNLDFTRVNMRPEEVPLDQEILGTTGVLLTGGQQQCAIVVLKDATSEGLEKSQW